MKTISAEVTGVVALLQHRYATEDQGAMKSKSKKKVYIPEEDAEKSIYRDEKGGVVEPSEHILMAMTKAASGFIFEGKKTFKDIITRGVTIDSETLPLLDKNGKQYKTWDEIDSRGAVVQRARIMRSRPKFNTGWKIRFNLNILEEDVLAPSTLKEILEKAGQVGIADYRPRFGRFQVTEWKENGKARN